MYLDANWSSDGGSFNDLGVVYDKSHPSYWKIPHPMTNSHPGTCIWLIWSHQVKNYPDPSPRTQVMSLLVSIQSKLCYHQFLPKSRINFDICAHWVFRSHRVTQIWLTFMRHVKNYPDPSPRTQVLVVLVQIRSFLMKLSVLYQIRQNLRNPPLTMAIFIWITSIWIILTPHVKI